MGKYQLDNKGQKSVGKFHEKNSTVGGKGINTKNATQAKIEALRAKMENKKNDKKSLILPMLVLVNQQIAIIFLM